jgi:hypothetical protein
LFLRVSKFEDGTIYIYITNEIIDLL